MGCRATADAMREVQGFSDKTIRGRCGIVHARNSGADVRVSPINEARSPKEENHLNKSIQKNLVKIAVIQ